MTPKDLRSLLDLAPNTPDDMIVIQLPDDEPPVAFTAEWMEDTLVLFPTPHAPHDVWDHGNNIIRSYNSTS